jgi:8-oxo-dGTP pyrophosphatase MutT (NUDIX family)
MQPTFSFDYFGSTIEATSRGSDFIPNSLSILSAHCVPFTDDRKIVAVDIVGRGIDIPGGHLEDNESAIDALRREIKEEAEITIDTPILVDVWQLSSNNEQLGLSTKPYLLLYSATILSIGEFTPSAEVTKRLILSPEDFIANYFGDKGQARILVNKALAMK